MYNKKSSLLNSIALFGLPLLLLACVPTEKEQFFDQIPSGSVGSIDPNAPEPETSATPSGQNGSPTQSATPNPSESPDPTQSTPTPSPIPTATPCTTAATTTKNLRIMFMVDNSGSTLDTDRNKNYRVKTVESFVQNYGSHTNLTYSFGYFGGTTAKEYDGSRRNFQMNPSVGFGNADFLTSALNLYKTIAPSGNTPYTAAFNSLKSMVQQDKATGVKQDYVVVFMSDGMPTDIYGNSNSGIVHLVQNLRTVVEANGDSLLTVSSVYFGPQNDNNAINNLRTVASEGKGQFVNTNELNHALQINDVITVPGSCQP